ncbi:histidine phosphotransferase family protein [Tabrizicola sp. J26]|uniref:histidine phosphotransferase family protein n=1 Tax=Alitabrizicola rongguiensis TaxID=2909234 RepID=UPI001F1BA221|nr:histidine phosphotransferase family protein [Tabrizicola rongguiensis]MCF1710259.1 histidine phosphotransferase family protein [Tabrizicola rongguiensis]
MTDRPDLAALIGSRICHDLVSPIGAICNGVELMVMERGRTSPELDLIADSVTSANAKLRFFRLAFGASGGQRVARAEVQSILAAYVSATRLAISWTSDPDLSRGEVKVLLLSLLCLETAMPWGGRVSVLQGPARWSVLAEAPRLKIDPGLWGSLQAPEPGLEVTPALVQFPLLAEDLRRSGRRFSAELGDGTIRLEL